MHSNEKDVVIVCGLVYIRDNLSFHESSSGLLTTHLGSEIVISTSVSDASYRFFT